MLAKVREIIHQAGPEIVEGWKWVKRISPGTAVFYHGGIICTGEKYKDHVKMTFAKGAALKDPSRLFNSSLEGMSGAPSTFTKTTRLMERPTDLLCAAVALNLKSKKPKHK